jgi:hypothetical protein
MEPTSKHKEFYGKWGYQKGTKCDPTKCAAEVASGWTYKQCGRPCGHGPANAYCKQHAALSRATA